MRPGSIPLRCPACAVAVSLAAFHVSGSDQPGVLTAPCRACGACLAMRWNAELGQMDISRAARAPLHGVRQASHELQALLATLDLDRTAMKQALSNRPSNVTGQAAARRALLASLEAYATGLARCNLPVPPRLRDELSLQRGLATKSPTPPPAPVSHRLPMKRSWSV